MVLSAAVPARAFLTQRGDIARVEASQAQQRERVAGLERRQQQLQDPEYLKQVARERFHYVLPGETLYEVLRPATEPPVAGRQGEATGSDASWYVRLWGSLATEDAG